MIPPSQQPGRRRIGRAFVASAVPLGVVALGFAFFQGVLGPNPSPRNPLAPPSLARSGSLPPLQLAAGRHLSVWWDELPADVLSSPSAGKSNIHPADYIGPEACKTCHAKNYNAWSVHPHRWMNALADAGTIKGDYSGNASLTYRGGKATFERRDGAYVMRLERRGLKRSYRITQTIGVRFFQYYVGKQIDGPEPPKHHFYHKDHVLPFGYWLDQKEWVPVVHIGPEMPDAERPDPFRPPDSGRHYAEYSASCNYCHTTFPLGDLLGRRPQQMGEHAPVQLHWQLRNYVAEAHPSELPSMARMVDGGTVENPMTTWEAERYAVTFGVSCEACHLGARAHVESGGKTLPKFFASSPHLSVEGGGERLDQGRSHDNVNWACGRCHTGARPSFAAGMSTWNSVEYSDAMRGSCYSKLRCIDCHSPHSAIGPKWSQPAAQDDAVCLKCHEQLKTAEKRLAHTHHPAGSTGDRCLNCHMPRINEGLQDVVRTHMIYSPTRADMIQANHPNACNLCHTEQPIDWTLRHLKEWYGRTYDEKEIATHYPTRARSVAQGWLASSNESVRLVAADALARTRDVRAIPPLLDALDDPYLLNRQFAVRGLQEMLGMRPADAGYRFTMSHEERQQPLADLRKHWGQATPMKRP